MDRIRAILQFQWRAYWRRFRRAGNFRTNNVGPLILIGGIAALRYLQNLPIAASQLGKGNTTRYQALLLLIFLAWMFPVMGESRRSISSRGLLHFPLTTNELFLIRLGSIFCSPVSWIVIAGSLALGYPVSAATHPSYGLAALLFFVLLALFTSLTITHVFNNRLARKLALVVLLIVSVLGVLLWLGKRTDILASLARVSPMHLAAIVAVSPAPLRSLAVLIGITVVVGLLAVWTFAPTLQPQHERRSQGLSLFGSAQLPGKFGGLLKKDLRYWSRLLDPYLSLPVVVFFNMYLFSDTSPSAVVLAVIVGLLFVPCLSLAFNCFGLDSPPGLDRYTLFPLSGREKLLSKNLAFATTMLALFVLLLPFTFVKLGLRASGLALSELLVVALAYAACGNWMSVRQAFKMQFYRFASGGSPVDAMLGVIFGSLPAAVTVYLIYRDDPSAVLKMLLLMIVYVGVFLFSLVRCGRILESHREEIRRALT